MSGDVHLPLLGSIPPALLPEDGEIVDEIDIAVIGDALGLAYHRAAQIVARLRSDGWHVTYSRSTIWCSHDDVANRAAAELRLSTLGVDLRMVQIG